MCGRLLFVCARQGAFSCERKFPFGAMQLLTCGVIFASVTTRGGWVQVAQL